MIAPFGSVIGLDIGPVSIGVAMTSVLLDASWLLQERDRMGLKWNAVTQLVGHPDTLTERAAAPATPGLTSRVSDCIPHGPTVSVGRVNC